MRYLAATGPIPCVYCARSFLELANCRRLVDEIDAGPLRAATLREPGRGDVATEHRRRADHLVNSSETQALVARRLAAITDDLAAHFDVCLSGLQPPQFLRYSRGCYFRPHQDRSDDPGHAADIRIRRITAVLFLNGQSPLPSDDDGYCGGDLRLFRADDHPDPTLCIAGETGMLVAFASAVVHEVRPVTWGVRRTVAAWYVDGP
jgi:predicted 2-oxoglutarate/Fe(II)-dependent dioxygenase YbiX